MFKEINILKVFFEEPEKEFNVREVARILKISPATISKNLKEFFKKGLLKYRKERILDFYKSNIESEFYRDLKIFYNIRKLKECGLIDELNNLYLKPTILLFGSYRYGIDTSNSDIDLVIITKQKKEHQDLKKFENKLNRKMHIFPIKNIKELKNEHLINNALNGIILQGEIKWI